MELVLEGLVVAWGTLLAVHLVSRRSDSVHIHHLARAYVATTIPFTFISHSEGTPNWILGIGLWFAGADIRYSLLWQAAEDLSDEQREPA